jgi:hypothetical protein
LFTPVLAKHTKSFNLIDTLSVGVDRIQRNFEPGRELAANSDHGRARETHHLRRVYRRQARCTEEPSIGGSSVIFSAGVSGVLSQDYVELVEPFTSAFKRLDPIPQFKATAKLGEFLNQLPA